MKKNKIILIFELVFNFFKSLFLSISLLIRNISWNKKLKPIPENKFLDAMNFLFQIWPKSFWKKPSWIKIGRSLATFLNYIFNKELNFKEKK